MAELSKNPAWQALSAHAREEQGSQLTQLFQQDAGRAQRFSLQAAGVFLDYSKQRITQKTCELLLNLAAERDVQDAIAAMFAGDTINRSENRAAWHVALRAPAASGFPQEIDDVLNAMAQFVDAVRSGEWRGYSGAVITDVVNIGIGGSDLGPRMVCRALAEPNAKPQLHFVANVDPLELNDVLARLDPATTLFVITSKSFTTSETLANARAARAWFLDGGAVQADIAKHFVAVSTNHAAVAEFGIDTQNMFGFWDWVGGRFSLWSAVGLPIALALGMVEFRQLLAGAHAMDEHFKSAPLAENLPVLLALIGVWNRNFLNMNSLVVAPYAQRLEYFCGWLQQLEMESNGKAVGADGAALQVASVPALWGSVGTNAQHAFFQMLHQGCDVMPVDFILALQAENTANDGRKPAPADNRHAQLLANCFAQAQALMQGKGSDALRAENVAPELLSQRSFQGNRPSNMLLLPRLGAFHLGALLAAYEHKVYVQGVIWGVNSFDQWGVELGKVLAVDILAQLEGEPRSEDKPSMDASTIALITKAKNAMRS